MRSSSFSMLFSGMSVALLLSACGGGTPANSAPKVQMHTDGTTTVTTDEGTMRTGGELPATWPSDAPVYPDATVAFSASTNPTTGKAGFGLMLTTAASTDDVAAFYKKELAGNGWTIAATMENAGTTVISATKDTRAMGLSIAGGEGTTSITIGIDMGEGQ